MNIIKDYFNSISALKDETWIKVLPLFEHKLLLKNQYFINVNETANKIGLLESGVVRAYFINNEGKEYNKQFFAGPSIIGAYTSLLTGQPNLIAQQALTDCKVYTCDYKALTSLFDTHQDLERLARKIAEFYFMEKEKKEIEIALLDASHRYKIFQNEFPKLEQHISQFHIASYLGISPTQLSRIRNMAAKG